ncbi:SRPBCC domain-containing protein [Nesterenkonia sp. YGD6]|uniref:SRPBCC family protein n=1 Tax=Nesterenkonia sp. YGD6 TaxID=2901231 RepID=UPI001F4CB73C|nr:SRPBCC domain-containing protein [Nesterenkonia sp. YGD6]MCH8561822.1 SRPBCC domain-containing protein [Nesterenkonia sp. YGD6]
MIDESKGFTLVRTFAATPEQVWTAWTDPDAAAQWFHPEGATTPRESVEMDVRVGGRYTYTMVNDEDGTEVVTAGVYREVSPFERLVFTWGDPHSDPDDAPVVTLVLATTDAGTQLTFDLRGAEGAKGDSFFYDGWDSALNVLDSFLQDDSHRSTTAQK